MEGKACHMCVPYTTRVISDKITHSLGHFSRPSFSEAGAGRGEGAHTTGDDGFDIISNETCP